MLDVGSHEEHKFVPWEEMKRKFDLFILLRSVLMEG